MNYDVHYKQDAYYWGKQPSALAIKILEVHPPVSPMTAIDIACGEGRNAVFLARNGYRVAAFDISEEGVRKARLLAREVGVEIEAFVADLLTYRLDKSYDVIFSTGSLHYIPPDLRGEIIQNYKTHTNHNGIHVMSVFVDKPFIPAAPDAEATAHLWRSGELFGHYHDWKIEFCTEDIFDCNSSGIPHQHAVNRIIARRTA